jgi:alcohol dehydrogenase class IV
MTPTSFRWRDGERVVRFGADALQDAPDLLGTGYLLLTTPRAAAAAPAIVDAAGERHDVPDGRVDDVGADLLEQLGDLSGVLIVALGGGRVIDTAKGIAGAAGARGVAAIPTTLSSAEMTPVHRPPRGRDLRPLRPRIVLNDPALCASQPEPQLAASAANALAHAVEAPTTRRASPVPTLAAHEAARLIAGAWAQGEPDRDALALGSLLAGYAIDGPGYGLHHVAAQTLVREGDVGHGAANAVLLPHTVVAMRRRAPEPMAALDAVLSADVAAVAADLARRAGAERLRDLGVDHDALPSIAAAAAARGPALANTPPVPDAAELLELYEAAW